MEGVSEGVVWSAETLIKKKHSNKLVIIIITIIIIIIMIIIIITKFLNLIGYQLP